MQQERLRGSRLELYGYTDTFIYVRHQATKESAGASAEANLHVPFFGKIIGKDERDESQTDHRAL